MLNKLKARKNQLQGKGGFTLVELIVVLVILAILAALLIPALTGYIDRAKEKNAIAECRQVVMAAQTLYDEEYAANTSAPTFDKNNTNKIKYSDVTDLAEVKGTLNLVQGDGKKISKVQYESGPVKVEYTLAKGYEVVKNFT